MGSRNPFGVPPRMPARGSSRGVHWYGQHWFIVDACAAVGIHVSAYNQRRKRGLSIVDALKPPSRRGWKPHGVAVKRRRPRMPTHYEIVAEVRALKERLDRIESGAIVLVTPRAA